MKGSIAFSIIQNLVKGVNIFKNHLISYRPNDYEFMSQSFMGAETLKKVVQMVQQGDFLKKVVYL